MILEMKGVNKRFGGIVVADEVSLSIDRGQILGLIGPNGAVKTSLFNLVSGVVPLDSGEIRVDGADVAPLRLHERARMGVSRTWQNMRLFQSMTVLENMVVATRSYAGESAFNLFFRPGSVRRADEAARERALKILGRMNLSQIAHAHPGDIPFGQQKLVGLARA